MKRIFLFLLFSAVLLLSAGLFAQGFEDIPKTAAKDTLSTRTRITKDIYFTPSNSASIGKDKYYGVVDFQVKGNCTATDVTDTLTIEVYGLLYKLLSGASAYAASAIDSHRVGTMPLTATSSWTVFNIDPLWTNFPMFDGLRFVIKKGGTDTDSVTVYTSVRLQPEGPRP